MTRMATKLTPPPDRFGVRRVGEPDRLAPTVAVPAGPETEGAPGAPLPASVPERETVPARSSSAAPRTG